MNYILDTNVISELVAPQPNPNLVHWIEDLDQEIVYLSVITVGELKKGVEKSPHSQRKTALEDWLNNDLLVRFKDQLLPIDTSVLLEWGALVARLEKISKPMGAIDSLLAATAVQSGFTIATRNAEDFEHVSVSVFNPWEYQHG